MRAQQNDARFLPWNLYQKILHRQPAGWRIRRKRIRLHAASVRLQLGLQIFLQFRNRRSPRRARPEVDLPDHLLVSALAVESTRCLRRRRFITSRDRWRSSRNHTHERWLCCRIASKCDRGAKQKKRKPKPASLPPRNHEGVSPLSAASCFLFFRTTLAKTAIPTKYSPTIGAMKINMVVASGVGVIIAATTAIIRTAYRKFCHRNFGVTMPNRVRKKIRLYQTNTSPSPSRIIRIKSKYSLMLISGATVPPNC